MDIPIRIKDSVQSWYLWSFWISLSFFFFSYQIQCIILDLISTLLGDKWFPGHTCSNTKQKQSKHFLLCNVQKTFLNGSENMLLIIWLAIQTECGHDVNRSSWILLGCTVYKSCWVEAWWLSRLDMHCSILYSSQFSKPHAHLQHIWNIVQHWYWFWGSLSVCLKIGMVPHISCLRLNLDKFTF